MTDKDIVKAAEHCLLNNGSCSSQCPLHDWSKDRWFVSSCLAKFCEFIIDKSKQSEGNICDLQTITDNPIAKHNRDTTQ